MSKHVVLKVNLNPNLSAVWGHAPQLRQVVMNLVINASEAIGEKDGVINVTTEQLSDGKNLTPIGTDLPAGDYVRLEVSDTGCGITEEAKAKIFDPFYTTRFVGRGLGLAVVQGIVRGYGGAINVMSAQGTTFRVLLPCTSKRVVEIQSAIPSSGTGQSDTLTGTFLWWRMKTLRLTVSKALRNEVFRLWRWATDRRHLS